MLTILSIIIIFIIILIIIGNYFINKLFIKNNKPLFKKKETNKEETENKKLIKEKRKIWFESNQNDIYTISNDNLKLHANMIMNDSNVYVIIVHPYEGRGSYMKYFAQKFYNIGFNVLCIDLRSHGDSEGKVYSLGYLERLDIIAWIDYINKNYKNTKIILYGISMGANAIMMSSCEDISNNVKVIIEDSGFTTAKEQLQRKLDILKYLPFLPIIQIISLMLKIRKVGFSIYDIDIIKSISKSKIPILFIHGDKDSLVDFSMLDKLYNACGSEKEKLIIEGGEHISAVFQNEYLYWNTVENFINKYID